MFSEITEPVLIEEKRLIGTLITQKPAPSAFYMATVTVIIMSLATLFFWLAPQKWTELLPAVQNQVFQHAQVWRVFTAMFIHGDIEHLLSNMFMLWIFSYFVFGYFGFSVFPLISLALGSLVNFIAILTYPPNIELIGASGLVYILGGFWLTLYFLIQRQYTLISRTLRVIGISLVIFIPSTFTVTTSYRTHAIGFLAGILMGLFYFYKNKDKIREHEVYKISWV